MVPATFARKRKKLSQATRALTLVEVLISLLLSVTMIMGIITLFQFNFMYQNQQELRANAMDAMVHEMERLRQRFIWFVEPKTVFVSDNRTPDNEDDDTIGRLRVRLFDRAGNELSSAVYTSDRLRVVMTVTWRGRGRFSTRTFHETLVAYMFP